MTLTAPRLQNKDKSRKPRATTESIEFYRTAPDEAKLVNERR
jgi:hypothetical protein